ncbi:nucleoside triphosphate pyrophosphohydrolase [Alteromonas sp. ASW11-130]|uniref:nucleoside triphosphate pyrophosphohydrolase n=1 Tax=Alteromonas sp. ASW11-130 TaxID=3015775 RepID=UPI002241E0DF|nr:nucleoside triphosphate pyrophosphohydrolase [Alteromonas sp. ASW11-130]MCW8090467.1 nucleoside triphosphate pyrophosphohydrolase [Alteromonas sp. ASW11-130]
MPNERPGNIDRLLSIMTRLRDPKSGCPWDLRQTMRSLVPYTIEEAYEVADAIEKHDLNDIRDELGDLLFQIIFYSQIAKEQDAFTFDAVVESICDKIIRRHPHVFNGKRISETELEAQWNQIKQEERAHAKGDSNSILDDIPNGLPALMYAQKVQQHCTRVGFDWEKPLDVLNKVQEEISEIKDELNADEIDQLAVEEEIGDAFFALVNLSRHCNVDADTALRRANNKFVTRFKQIEHLAQSKKQKITDMTLVEMEKLWQQVKSAERDK